MKRLIVALTTEDGLIELGKNHNGYVVKAIEFKRDGLVSINADCGPSYQVVLQDQAADKVVIFNIIPYREIKGLLYINSENVEVDPAEIAQEMKRVE